LQTGDTKLQFGIDFTSTKEEDRLYYLETS